MIISKIATAGFASLAMTVERGYGRIYMIISKIVPSEGRGFSLCGTTPALSRKYEIASSSRPSSMAGPPRNDSRRESLRGVEYTGIATAAYGGLAMTERGLSLRGLRACRGERSPVSAIAETSILVPNTSERNNLSFGHYIFVFVSYFGFEYKDLRRVHLH